MLAAKILINGTIVRIERGKFIVRSGERVDMYNPDYYRIAPDCTDPVEGRSSDKWTGPEPNATSYWSGQE